MIPGGARGVRAVMHRDINDEDVVEALKRIASVVPQAVPSA
jgi:hypothetical protein